MYLANLPFIFLLFLHPPLATKLMNWLEIYNELIIMACTCMLLGFSDYPETPVGDGYGWTFIGLASSIIVATLLAIGHQAFTALCKRLEQRRLAPPEKAQIYAVGAVDATDCIVEDIEGEGASGSGLPRNKEEPCGRDKQEIEPAERREDKK